MYAFDKHVPSGSHYLFVSDDHGAVDGTVQEVFYLRLLVYHIHSDSAHSKSSQLLLVTSLAIRSCISVVYLSSPSHFLNSFFQFLFKYTVNNKEREQSNCYNA
jgi:hypothetical protein